MLAELELWPNLIASASRHGAKVAVVNARLSERSARGYGRVARLMRWLLGKLDLVASQSDEYAQRFRSLGAPDSHVIVTGSIKFDGACADRDNEQTRQLTRWAGYDEQDWVWVVGSTQAPEESLAIEAYQRLKPRFPQLRLVLAPRHPERREEVLDGLRQAGLDVVCRSDARSPSPGGTAACGGMGRERVLLVDVVGELGAWWGRADAAFVGGSMGHRGGQNMIEPAAYGCPVSFGPKTKNFRDVVLLLLAHDAAIVVRDGRQMREFVERCLQDEGFAKDIGRRAQQLVLHQQGAADATIHELLSLLDSTISGVIVRKAA